LASSNRARAGRVAGPGAVVGLLDEQIDEQPAGPGVTGVLDGPAGSGEVCGGFSERQS
jgi:hypothetical protein